MKRITTLACIALLGAAQAQGAWHFGAHVRMGRHHRIPRHCHRAPRRAYIPVRCVVPFGIHPAMHVGFRPARCLGHRPRMGIGFSFGFGPFRIW
jgi:hypothetical protein